MGTKEQVVLQDFQIRPERWNTAGGLETLINQANIRIQ